MATKEFYYYTIHNQDYWNAVAEFDLPDGETSINNNWLYYKNLTDDQINEIIEEKSQQIKKEHSDLTEEQICKLAKEQVNNLINEQRLLAKKQFNNLTEEQVNKIKENSNLTEEQIDKLIKEKVYNIIKKERLKNYNDLIKYAHSHYKLNTPIFEYGHTQDEKDKEVHFNLLESGYYYIQASSAGGKNIDLERFVGKWTITNKNGDITDTIEIFNQNKDSYTWERTKKENDDEKFIWKGTYTYLHNTIFLSWSEYTYEYKEIKSVKKDIEDYGILMFDGTNKLRSFRSDDTVDEKSIEYTNLSYRDTPTTDSKGGDGEYLNEVFSLKTDQTLTFKIGQTGQESIITDLETDDIVLHSGETEKSNYFGGRGGSFVYDYYGRIKYDNSLPEDGQVKISYLVPVKIYNNDKSNLTINTDENIKEISCPKNNVPPWTVVTVKVLLEDNYEIDYEKSTINEMLFKDHKIRMDINNKPQDVLVVVSEYDYYNVQTITFPMPDKDTVIDLKTKKVKYSIEVSKDEYIQEYSLSRESEDDKEIVTLTVTYTDKNHFVNREIFAYYLCLDLDEIEFKDRDRNNTHTITFTMPERNVILKLVSDSLFILNINLNERQEFEENIKTNGRFIEKVILISNHDTDHTTIENFPYITQVSEGTVFDLYVKFTDIYQHLDKQHLYSQYPSVQIEEAGDFDTSPETWVNGYIPKTPTFT